MRDGRLIAPIPISKKHIPNIGLERVEELAVATPV
jgi:hypothetical protein